MMAVDLVAEYVLIRRRRRSSRSERRLKGGGDGTKCYVMIAEDGECVV